MKEAQLSKIRDWFLLYARTYKASGYGELENIVLKEMHSRRVAEEVKGIGIDLGLDGDSLRLAEATALLHDIGRFEQYLRYGTFVDSMSVDHAKLGAEIIESRGILDGLSNSEKKIIISGVLYHNRYALPEDLDERTLFFCRLLRDADKLDILKVMLDYYSKENHSDEDAVGLHLPEGSGVSPEVIEDLMEMRTVRAEHLKNRNDFKLLQVSWVYDINFPPSMKRVVERDHIVKLRDILPRQGDIDSAIELALKRAISITRA